MTCWYLDTSAAMKLIAAETESEALSGAIDAEQPDLVSCLLLETELRRVVTREPALTQEIASQFLDGVALYDVPSSLFREAGLLPGLTLRFLNAIHLAAAIRIGVDRVVTYDAEMHDAAKQLGLSVFAPT